MATLQPSLYAAHREAVIVACKLLSAAVYPVFRLSWQARGTPLDVRAGFGGTFARLPLHPLAVLQCGAVLLLGSSIRHSLRFKTQLFCQLVMLVAVIQAETVSGRGP